MLVCCCVFLGNVRNNAGVMFCPFQLTEDGIESQFATNHIGKFSFNASLYILNTQFLTKICNIYTHYIDLNKKN